MRIYAVACSELANLNVAHDVGVRKLTANLQQAGKPVIS